MLDEPIRHVHQIVANILFDSSNNHLEYSKKSMDIEYSKNDEEVNYFIDEETHVQVYKNYKVVYLNIKHKNILKMNAKMHKQLESCLHIFSFLSFLFIQTNNFHLPYNLQMNFCKKLKSFVRTADFFHSIQLLRYKKENQYRTKTGGLISLIIIVVIVVGFARMIIDTLNLSIYNYTLKYEKQNDPKPTNFTASPEKNFMFGIELTSYGGFNRLNITETSPYLNIKANIFQVQAGNIKQVKKFELQACTRNHWKSVNSVLKNFEKLQVGKWLCPKIGSNFNLEGKFTSDKSSFLQFSASACDRDEQECAGYNQTEQFFAEHEQTFYFTIYFINTLINPDQPTYLEYYLQEKAYITFSRRMGVESFLQFCNYQIQSDNSIWPFSSTQQETGFIVQSLHSQYPYNIFGKSSRQYFTFTFAKGDITAIYKRQVQKISNVFSFMGGLIGAIVAFLFIINSFTNYSYEISLANDLFQKDEQKLEMRTQIETEFGENGLSPPNIIQYLRFIYYEIKKKLFTSMDRDDKMEKIIQCRNEILEQLNIKTVMKRLIFLQFCISQIMSPDLILQCQNNLPYNPSQIKKLREKDLKRDIYIGSDQPESEQKSKSDSSSSEKKYSQERMRESGSKNSRVRFCFNESKIRPVEGINWSILRKNDNIKVKKDKSAVENSLKISGLKKVRVKEKKVKEEELSQQTNKQMARQLKDKEIGDMKRKK